MFLLYWMGKKESLDPLRLPTGAVTMFDAIYEHVYKSSTPTRL